MTKLSYYSDVNYEQGHNLKQFQYKAKRYCICKISERKWQQKNTTASSITASL